MQGEKRGKRKSEESKGNGMRGKIREKKDIGRKEKKRKGRRVMK